MNTQFAVTIHALTLLAAGAEPLTSEAIAASVDTNAVVIRRAMAGLRERGIVESKPGANGGWKLARPPKEIRLCDVYRSICDEGTLFIHEHPNSHCRIGKNIRGALQTVFDSAHAALEKELGNFTVADVLADVLARAK